LEQHDEYFESIIHHAVSIPQIYKMNLPTQKL